MNIHIKLRAELSSSPEGDSRTTELIWHFDHINNQNQRDTRPSVDIDSRPLLSPEQERRISYGNIEDNQRIQALRTRQSLETPTIPQLTHLSPRTPRPSIDLENREQYENDYLPEPQFESEIIIPCSQVQQVVSQTQTEETDEADDEIKEPEDEGDKIIQDMPQADEMREETRPEIDEIRHEIQEPKMMSVPEPEMHVKKSKKGFSKMSSQAYHEFKVEQGKKLAERMREARRTGKSKKMRQSTAKRAGLIFPAKRIQRNLKQLFPEKRIGLPSAIYMGAVLEYLCAEALELSGEVAIKLKRHSIQPRHLFLALKNDAEFDKLLGDVVMPYSGVVPILPDKSGRKLHNPKIDMVQISDPRALEQVESGQIEPEDLPSEKELEKEEEEPIDAGTSKSPRTKTKSNPAKKQTPTRSKVTVRKTASRRSRKTDAGDQEGSESEYEDEEDRRKKSHSGGTRKARRKETEEDEDTEDEVKEKRKTTKRKAEEEDKDPRKVKAGIISGIKRRARSQEREMKQKESEEEEQGEEYEPTEDEEDEEEEEVSLKSKSARMPREEGEDAKKRIKPRSRTKRVYQEHISGGQGQVRSPEDLRLKRNRDLSPATEKAQQWVKEYSESEGEEEEEEETPKKKSRQKEAEEPSEKRVKVREETPRKKETKQSEKLPKKKRTKIYRDHSSQTEPIISDSETEEIEGKIKEGEKPSPIDLNRSVTSDIIELPAEDSETPKKSVRSFVSVQIQSEKKMSRRNEADKENESPIHQTIPYPSQTSDKKKSIA